MSPADTTERLYMQLELRKIFQMHHRFPTTFIYPSGLYSFEGITGKGGIPARFRLAKAAFRDTWKITMTGVDDDEDTGCTSLCDVLLRYFAGSETDGTH